MQLAVPGIVVSDQTGEQRMVPRKRLRTSRDAVYQRSFKAFDRRIETEGERAQNGKNSGAGEKGNKVTITPLYRISKHMSEFANRVADLTTVLRWLFSSILGSL